jgi:hypothetical protein
MTVYVTERCVRWKWRYIPPGVSVWLGRGFFYLQWSNRRGFMYRSVMKRFPGLHPRNNRQYLMDATREKDMRRKVVANIPTAAFHASADPLLAKFKDLDEFLRSATFEGQTEMREAPTITLWAGGGQWKVSVKDRAENLVLWLSASTLTDLLVLLDSMVLSEEAPWRCDENGHERKGKRIQKSS